MARSGSGRLDPRSARRAYRKSAQEAEAPGQPVDQPASTEFLDSIVDLETRTIYLTDIDHGMCSAFIRAMHVLDKQGDFPITIIINSHGGDWHDGFAIYDTIMDSSSLVVCEVRGKCMSMGVIIAQACDRRQLMPHAIVMVHNGSAGADGDALNFEKWAAHSKSERKRMYEILAERSGRTPAFWQKKCLGGDLILNADQAVELGLFDEVIRP